MDLFCLLNPLAEPWGLDAFSIPWRFQLMYALPPLHAVPRALRKFRGASADLILVTPFWPKRSWLSVLLSLSVCPPWTLPLQADLLTQGPIRHPHLADLHLTACFLRPSCSEQGGWMRGYASLKSIVTMIQLWKR